jgi:hypothetical protein
MRLWLAGKTAGLVLKFSHQPKDCFLSIAGVMESARSKSMTNDSN